MPSCVAPGSNRAAVVGSGAGGANLRNLMDYIIIFLSLSLSLSLSVSVR